ncbi:MAG TPA: GAF domain-containing protein, partial [Ktedonobacteraceae bacterium]|nr:GAF domain-containing protein [Ktedonobacteraceae bacterium]
KPIEPSPIYNIILQQALAQLDPNSVGMSITVALCLPPAPGEKVRTLREGLGRGTFPWETHLENQPYLLGADSLAGHVVSSFRPVVNQNLRQGPSMVPVCRTEWEESSVVYPLLRGVRIAGALIVSSNKPNYFTLTLLQLVQKYAHLMILACSPEQFYDQSQISLRLVPHPDRQPPYFATFQQRVTEKILWARQHEDRTITRIEAEALVWQDLEEELIQVYLQSIPSTNGG